MTIERTREYAVAILTLNEEDAIARCIQSIPKGISIFVVDSGSTDKTIQISRSLGAYILFNEWNGFADQRNFSLLSIKGYKWIIFIDADERYPNNIFQWADNNLTVLSNFDLVQISSRLLIDGVMLNYAPGYPIYHPRIARAGCESFVQSYSGHGEAAKPGLRVLNLDIPYEHSIHNGDFWPWFDKMAKKAKLEALTKDKGAAGTTRSKINRFIPRGPFRPIARFIYHYIFCRGFLDGNYGLLYSLMFSWYEITIEIYRIHNKANASGEK